MKNILATLILTTASHSYAQVLTHTDKIQLAELQAIYDAIDTEGVKEVKRPLIDAEFTYDLKDLVDKAEDSIKRNNDMQNWSLERRARRFCSIASISLSNNQQRFSYFYDLENAKRTTSLLSELYQICASESINSDEYVLLAQKSNLTTEILNKKYQNVHIEFENNYQDNLINLDEFFDDLILDDLAEESVDDEDVEDLL